MARDPLRAAQRLFKRIKKCNRDCISRTGAIDPKAIADLIQKALDDDINRRGVLLAISEYIGIAMEGVVVDVDTWRPLEYLPRPYTK